MMTFSAKLLCVLALGLVICLPGMALADYASPTFTENGTSPWDDTQHTFDTVMEIISGNTFSQNFTNTSPAGWTSILSGDQLTIVATGSTVGAPLGTTFSWVEHYAQDPASTAFTVAEYVYSGGLNGTYLWGATYNNATGNLVGGPLSNPVPLPASALLLGSGLMGLGLVSWRRQRS